MKMVFSILVALVCIVAWTPSQTISQEFYVKPQAETDFWQPTGPLPGGGIWALASDSLDYIYAGVFDNGVYRSTDHGGSWNPTNNGLGGTIVYAFAFHPKGDIFVTTNYGLFRSTNHGTSWSLLCLFPEFCTPDATCHNDRNVFD